MNNKDKVATVVIYFIVVIIAAVIFISIGISSSFSLFKKRSKDCSFIQYQVTDEYIIITTMENTKRIRIEEIKEVVVIYPWIYLNKGYGDVYFKVSEKELVTTGRSPIETKSKVPTAAGFIAIDKPEELAEGVINIINLKRGSNLKYQVKKMWVGG